VRCRGGPRGMALCGTHTGPLPCMRLVHASVHLLRTDGGAMQRVAVRVPVGRCYSRVLSEHAARGRSADHAAGRSAPRHVSGHRLHRSVELAGRLAGITSTVGLSATYVGDSCLDAPIIDTAWMSVSILVERAPTLGGGTCASPQISGAVLVDGPVLGGIQGGLGAAVEAELGQYVVDVGLDGALTDGECAGNLAIRLALTQEAEYRGLAVGEALR
jgi:hypothetical protein